uniref:Uncharacterized protein n=1 Tax=Globisporangium ultimum (strain ATCC 200006 / CBS 805.95 / DAOM BR144) TaxID=431595 RepID=K3XBT0_GLOUD
MGCSGPGLFAIIVLFAAVVLNAVAVILPAWSSNNSKTDSGGKADFAAGVWGFCTDIELDTASSNASVKFDHCYFYYTANDYEAPELNDSQITGEFAEFSVCDGYNRAKEQSDLVGNLCSQGLAQLAGLEHSEFDRFLDRSCGSLGKATLTFASLSITAGVFAFISLVLGVTCCKAKSWVIQLGRLLAVAGFVMTVLAFVLWISQASPLSKKDDVGKSVSFTLSVAAAVLYVVVVALVTRHTMKQ